MLLSRRPFLFHSSVCRCRCCFSCSSCCPGMDSRTRQREFHSSRQLVHEEKLLLTEPTHRDLTPEQLSQDSTGALREQ